MNPDQIASYNALSDTIKHILKVCAVEAYYCSYSKTLVAAQTSINCTNKDVKEAFACGLKHGFLREIGSSYGYLEVTAPFMIFIFPQLKSFVAELKVALNQKTPHGDGVYALRNFLYTRLYTKKSSFPYEKQLMFSMRYSNLLTHALLQLLDYPAYAPHLLGIDRGFSNLIMDRHVTDLYFNLAPLNEIVHFVNTAHSAFGRSEDISDECKWILFLAQLHGGVFEDADCEQPLGLAIQSLRQGDTTAALLGFQSFLKASKDLDVPGIPVLPKSEFALLFYLLTLLRMDLLLSMPIFKKIEKHLVKKGTTSYTCINILYAVLNDIDRQDIADEMFLEMYHHLESLKVKPQYILNYICAYYVIDKIPDKKIITIFLKHIQKAIDGGYYLLAIEAAYAYNQWNGTNESEALLASVQQFLIYPPVLAGFTKIEEWEKSLNILVDLETTAAKNADARVAYKLQLQSNQMQVQPVAQVLQKSGWSAGKAIPLKLLYTGKAKGMTEQDFRIARTIREEDTYYGDDRYEFDDHVVLELIGHPHLFVNGGKNIPMELIEKRPLIQVIKKDTDYHLTTTLKSCDKNIIIEKETNTRYLVYQLTNHQLRVLQVIADQKIVVPESGKEKLIQLLAGFSTQMEVHSDLLATESSQLKIEEVTADNRIHIQLLPLGTGIKAELFSKPFGTRPPYCKPGLGGKNLIANEKGVQLQVKRDLKQERAYADLLMNEIQMIESVDVSDDLIAFEDPLDSLLLLEIIAKNATICVAEWPEGVKYKIKASVGFDKLSMRLKSGVAWFDLQGELKVDEKTVLSLQQLMALSEQSHNRFIELSSGEFIALSKELKKQLEDLRAFTVGNKNGVQVNKFAAEPLSDFFNNVEDLKTDKAWKDFQKRITQAKKETFVVPNTLQADLRPYQEEGFKWMARLAEWEAGACLADDMGLGKTVQTIAILLHRAQLGTALVVCPVSVLGNWIRELERFAPTLQIKTLGASSGKGREQVFDTLEKGDVLISTYGLLQSEEKLFCRDTFATLVLDEAHTIKNNATKTSKSTMQLKAQFRIALTGTPLQNHLGEIWNLFHFINPGLLGSLQHFTDTFIKPTDPNVRKQLKKLITPFILRRTKSAVLDELPPKTEIIKKIELSKDEMAFYEAIRRSALENIATASTDNRFQVMAEITKLRQASCNPLLVDPAIQIPSSKLEAFLEIVDDLIENKHRALVFSQFVTHLSIMKQALDAKGIRYQYLDGSCTMPNREESVKKFQSGEGDLFLISLKAGGLGLNLTAADYVIHLDPWWNPAIEDQASDRAHRIGQLRPVTIYRLVSENTIEEKIIQLHNTKRDLAESLLEGSDQSGKLSINELIALIKN